ncbi:hypothetical protein L218DRAFT_212783 [Marasmius fiardii PR-910]|nr:hypothetical protein L218DRAFT_212783 [Marasmius fiardii PR-910]
MTITDSRKLIQTFFVFSFMGCRCQRGVLKHERTRTRFRTKPFSKPHCGGLPTSTLPFWESRAVANRPLFSQSVPQACHRLNYSLYFTPITVCTKATLGSTFRFLSGSPVRHSVIIDMLSLFSRLRPSSHTLKIVRIVMFSTYRLPPTSKAIDLSLDSPSSCCPYRFDRFIKCFCRYQPRRPFRSYYYGGRLGGSHITCFKPRVQYSEI